jgi:hypothetical protein
MKKVILLAAFSVAGLVSAKNAEEIKTTKETEKKESFKEVVAEDPDGKMQCYEWAMYVWCLDVFVTDTVCWGAGSGTATHAQAVADEVHNSQLLTEYHCGLGTQHGWGTGNGGH